jgi:hypothetical protein
MQSSFALRLFTAVAAVVLFAAGLVAVAVHASPESSPKAGPVPAAPAAEPAPDPAPTTTGPGADPADASEPDAIREIREEVARLRGLEWKAPLALKVVSDEELVRRIREVNARDIDPADLAGEGETYKLLHVIPRDLDYAGTLDQLYAELVLGFYDPITREMFVRDPGGESLEPMTRITIAHELDHALTDQHFDFGSRLDALDKAGRDEEAAAFVALVEGDAKLLENAWAEEHLSEEELLILLFGGVDASEVEDIPQFMLDVLMAPYVDGLDFVSALADEGGFRRVDEAYARPPTSTEQVLHPELYLANEGWSPPALPDLAAETGCGAVHTGTLGEAQMAEVIDAAGAGVDGADATRGWAGDSYQVVNCDGALGMVDRWQGDDTTAADRFEDALSRWASEWSGGDEPGGDGTFAGSEGAGRIVRRGNVVDLVLADDRPTADRLAAVAG